MDIRIQGKRISKLVLVGTVAAFVPTAVGQQSVPQPSGDYATLKSDVELVKAQQQQILARLDELKRLFNAKPVGNPQAAIKLPDTIRVEGELFRGEPTAAVAIIEYGDIECPFCRRFKQDIYPQVYDEYIKTGKARFYYRDMPLTFHEHALPAARAEHCAGEQGKFWEMHDSLFTEKPATIGPGGRKVILTQGDIDERARELGLDTPKLDDCIASTRYAELIKRNTDEAARMNIEGTPTFLIGTIDRNGNIVTVKTPVVGALPFGAFRTAIDPLLAATSPDTHASKPAPDGGTVQAASTR